MAKKIFSLLILCVSLTSNAQTFLETFDSNSLEWTECTFDNDENIKSYIEKGVLVVHSERNTNIWTGEKSYSTASSMCYMPIDIKKPFEIRTSLTYSETDSPFSIAFNLKDDGTYYRLFFIPESKKVFFQRVENREVVGGWVQGVLYPKLKKGEELEILISGESQDLYVEIQRIPVFKIRYVTYQYQGFGFLTHGEQEIKVNSVEFKQL